MTSPNRRAVATLSLVLAAAGCGGPHRPPAGSAPSSGPPASEAYNAEQLAQALLTEIPGYTRSGPPQRGPYSSLAAVQNTAQMQQAARLDKPQCAASTRAVALDKAVRGAPSALAAFARGRDQTVSETLMAVGPDIAARQVGQRVPPACRTFRVRVGDRWATGTVVEANGDRIGEGSRSVGVSTTAGAATVRTWYVVLRSRGYLAAVALFGPGATRNEAERIARQAYQQAERILP